MRIIKCPADHWTKIITCDCGTEFEIEASDIVFHCYWYGIDDCYVVCCPYSNCGKGIKIDDLPMNIRIDIKDKSYDDNVE